MSSLEQPPLVATGSALTNSLVFEYFLLVVPSALKELMGHGLGQPNRA